MAAVAVGCGGTAAARCIAWRLWLLLRCSARSAVLLTCADAQYCSVCDVQVCSGCGATRAPQAAGAKSERSEQAAVRVCVLLRVLLLTSVQRLYRAVR